MLHEILLSLSGHPSPLFTAKNSRNPDASSSPDFPLISPPERALLQRIGRLSCLHRESRDHAASLSSSHPSTIARAVATAIVTVHLARFQKKILDVEASILKRDAAVVGAYSIVPLASIVGEFDEWGRRLEWYSQLVAFMRGSDGKDACTGAALIDKLRQEAQTGYPDIEVVSLELGRVAETAWLRQLSSWVLYGRLPVVGAEDFFVQKGEDELYESRGALVPKIVQSDTAASILFIGNSLNMIRDRGNTTHGLDSRKGQELANAHLQHLSSLSFPLTAAALANAITAIRTSLSRNLLQHLLPLSSILQILHVLQGFFLLQRGDFATALVGEADAYLRARSRSSKGSEGLKGVLIKDAELTSILNKTLGILASRVDEDSEDASLDFAREILRLTTAKASSTRPYTPRQAKTLGDEKLPAMTSTSFGSFLLPSSTVLGLSIYPPFDLLLSQSEIDVYAHIHSYLLSIRRAHLKLCDLWRQTGLRKMHPAPVPNTSASERTRRERAEKRAGEMRVLWATSSAAVFLLGEMSNFFEGEIIRGSWDALRAWISQEERPSSSRSQTTEKQEELSPHDPALLTASHRRFLSSLARQLLLTDTSFTASLHALLQHIDALTALTLRLHSLQQALDLEEDEGVLSDALLAANDEDDIKKELGRARKRVDAGLRSVVARLRDLDGAEVVEEEDGVEEEGTFVPWRGDGVEGLLMRVDGRRGMEGGDDDDEG